MPDLARNTEKLNGYLERFRLGGVITPWNTAFMLST